jgi:peptidoglycan/LPS O-acetylase OafA/YrhL
MPRHDWRRTLVRYATAVASAGVALVYFLIGVGVITVVNGPSVDAPPMLLFGGLAGGAFALGAILLLTFDRRILWVLGAVLQIFVIWAYFGVAPSRDPHFEPWGIGLKVAQAILLLALVYLAAGSARRSVDPRVIRRIER